MKVQHNYLSQITKNFQPLQTTISLSAEEGLAFYLANDHNQSFIIYRIKDWGLFDSVVIYSEKLFATQNNWQGADAGKTAGQKRTTVPFQHRNYSQA